ncbi:hypothetical protein L4D00_23995 [Photobacterium swingsii]
MFDCAVKEKVIIYIPKYREFNVLVPDGGSSFITIMYCPWCASKLPSPLRDAWFDILDELGCEPGDKDIPPEMQTDIWWRDKGL